MYNFANLELRSLAATYMGLFSIVVFFFLLFYLCLQILEGTRFHFFLGVQTYDATPKKLSVPSAAVARRAITARASSVQV